jgi:hypothetical protein
MITQDMQAAQSRPTQPSRMGKEKKAVLDVLLGHQRNGAKDMTRTEIQYAYEMLHGKRIGDGRVASIVAKLLKANLIGQGQRRICSRTANDKGTVCVTPEQARMFS